MISPGDIVDQRGPPREDSISEDPQRTLVLAAMLRGFMTQRTEIVPRDLLSPKVSRRREALDLPKILTKRLKY